MYADDHHPPHFHIVSVDFEVLVRISDFSVIEGSVRPAQIVAALEWASANRKLLERAWSDLNRRI
jgi:hypothetical protein